MSLFFRQILILRHYVNYIEEKQDKSSIFLSSSVHTQAGVDIKILRDTPAPTSSYHVVALPSAAARSLRWSSSLPLADNGGVPTKTKTGVTVITPSTQSIRRTKTTTWCQTYRAAPNPFWHVSGGVNASIGGSGVPTIGRLLLSAANGVADHHHHLLRRVMAK